MVVAKVAHVISISESGGNLTLMNNQTGTTDRVRRLVTEKAQ